MAAASIIGRLDGIFRGETPLVQKMPNMPRTPNNTMPSTDKDAVVVMVTHAQELTDLDKFIDGEIEGRLAAANMTWRKLDTCFKWRMLQAYMKERGLAEGSDAYVLVRELLRTHQLTSVEYDCRGQAVTRLNHEACASIDEPFPPSSVVPHGIVT
jgi:hypothetical protein